MIIVESDKTVFCDVDDTLIAWHPSLAEEDVVILEDGSGQKRAFKVLRKNVEALKLHNARGHYVVVWSHGGWEWARRAVDLLGLEPYVDLVIAKPAWAIDDLPASEIIPTSVRRFYE